MNDITRRLVALSRHPAFLAALLIALAGPPAAGPWLHRQLIAEPQAEALAAAARQAADAAAQSVAAAVARLRLRLSGFAAGEVARAGLHPGGATAAQAGLQALFPAALEARVINGPEQLPPTDFLAQQLARAVLGGSAFEAAALKLGDGGWALLLAVPITLEARPRGIALVRLPAAVLADEIGFEPAQGRLSIRQGGGDESQVFLQLGRGGRSPGASAPVANVPGWQVTLTLSPRAVAAHAPARGMEWLLALGPWLLGLALVAAVGRRLWPTLDRRPPATSAPADPAPPRARREPLVVEREAALERPPAAEPPTTAEADPCPAAVFRDYDIRGASGSQISPAFAEALGRAFGSLVRDREGRRVAVARDGRNSSPALHQALIEGLLATGCDVVDIGLAPTPVLCFAAARVEAVDATVMVTASHNPAGDNGFKITLKGAPLLGKDLRRLRDAMLARAWRADQGGRLTTREVRDQYLHAIAAEVPSRSRRTVVVDCGNGAASEFAPQLLEALGCDVVPLYCEVDGAFPHHPPDPSRAANLRDLRKVVAATEADLGVALDGDGDRLVAVSRSGRIVWPDELLMIFARDILSAHPGADIVYDVKSSRRLGNLISSYGGRPVMCRTGHCHIRNKTAELDAPLGGEFSGHIFFRDRWLGCDDALYAVARLLEILNLREQDLDGVLATLEAGVASEEIRLPVPEQDKFALIERARAAARFEDAKMIDIDGLRVEFAEGWGLVRASNTEAAITLRFEARDQPQLEAIRARFQALLDEVAPTCNLRI